MKAKQCVEKLIMFPESLEKEIFIKIYYRDINGNVTHTKKVLMSYVMVTGEPENEISFTIENSDLELATKEIFQ